MSSRPSRIRPSVPRNHGHQASQAKKKHVTKIASRLCETRSASMNFTGSSCISPRAAVKALPERIFDDVENDYDDSAQPRRHTDGQDQRRILGAITATRDLRALRHTQTSELRVSLRQAERCKKKHRENEQPG